MSENKSLVEKLLNNERERETETDHLIDVMGGD